MPPVGWVEERGGPRAGPLSGRQASTLTSRPAACPLTPGRTAVLFLRCFWRPGRRPVPARGRRTLLTPQMLEDRTLLSGIPFAFALSDPNHEFAPYPYLMT